MHTTLSPELEMLIFILVIKQQQQKKQKQKETTKNTQIKSPLLTSILPTRY